MIIIISYTDSDTHIDNDIQNHKFIIITIVIRIVIISLIQS